MLCDSQLSQTRRCALATAESPTHSSSSQWNFTDRTSAFLFRTPSGKPVCCQSRAQTRACVPFFYWCNILFYCQISWDWNKYQLPTSNWKETLYIHYVQRGIWQRKDLKCTFPPLGGLDKTGDWKRNSHECLKMKLFILATPKTVGVETQTGSIHICCDPPQHVVMLANQI